MSPALEQGTPAKKASALALKIKAQLEAAAKDQKKGYGSIPATIGVQSDGMAFILFNPKDFVLSIGKSDSGKTEGCNLILSGELPISEDGEEVTYLVEGRLPVKARVKLGDTL